MTWLIALLQMVGNSATGGAVVVLADSACCSARSAARSAAGAGLSAMVRIDPEIAAAIAAGVLGVSGRLAVARVRAAAAPVGLG